MDNEFNEKKIDDDKILSNEEFMKQLERQIADVKHMFSDYEKNKEY